MDKLMQPLRQYFLQLSSREQLILTIGAPLAIFIILFMLLNHSYNTMASERSLYQESREQYRWLRTDTGALNRWQAVFGKRSLGHLNSAAELGVLLNDSLKKYGVRGSVSPTNNGNWQVKLKASNGNRLLSYIEAAVGSGASPVLVKLTRADDRGNVSGQLVFAALLP